MFWEVLLSFGHDLSLQESYYILKKSEEFFCILAIIWIEFEIVYSVVGDVFSLLQHLLQRRNVASLLLLVRCFHVKYSCQLYSLDPLVQIFIAKLTMLLELIGIALMSSVSQILGGSCNWTAFLQKLLLLLDTLQQ